MKTRHRFLFSISTLTLLASLPLHSQAQSQEVARVISSTPIVTQVSAPRQVCHETQVITTAPKSGAGALMGAIAGGAIGSQIGGGSGRALATAAGVVGGAIFGDNVEGAPQPVSRPVTTCGMQNSYENRVTAYNVVYEYAGKQYSIQLPNDPGPYLPIQVTPSVVAAPPVTVAPPTVITAPVVTTPVYVTSPYPSQVWYGPSVYPAPYYGPGYGPAVSLRFGYGGGYGGHRHGPGRGHGR